MSILPTRSAVCPILIGRVAQFGTLAQLIAQAADGQSSVAVIAGEAGVGKSRLLAEAKPVAVQHGFRILQGNCFEQDRSFPYAPLIDLLRSYAVENTLEALAGRLGNDAQDLVCLLPELASRIPRLPHLPVLDPEQEKRRLFQALTLFFTQSATDQPLFIAIEDLHWSDETSLEFLLRFVRRLGERPILLVLTYRTYEPHEPLSHFLAELDREHVGAELTLARLARDEVNAMVQAIFQSPRDTTGEFLDSLYDLTDGNPFFVEETLKALIASGDIYYENGEWTRKPMNELHVPRSVHDAVARRASRLSNDARQAMTFASVFGQRFDFGLLRSLTGRGEDDLLASIKEMIEAQLVEEESAERFVFRHALTRQAVYSDLLARERIAMHKAIAETIEHDHADSPERYLAELSYHFYEAGAWEEGLTYSRRAGDVAARLYAHGEALCHYDRARGSALHLERTDQLIAIDEAIGDVYFTRGEYPRSAESYQSALLLATSVASRARLKAKQGAAHTWTADERGRSLLETALVELDPETQANELARALVWLARIHWHAMRYSESIDLSQRARLLAEPLDDADTLDWIYRQLASTSDMQLRLDEGVEWSRRCVALGERKQYPQAVIHGYTMLSQSFSWRGEWQDGLKYAVEAQELCERIDRPLDAAWSNYWRCCSLYGMGDLSAALAAARTALANARELRESRLTVDAYQWLVLLETDTGNEEAAQCYADRALEHARALHDVQLLSVTLRNIAHLTIQREEWEQALALFEQCDEVLAGKEAEYERMLMGADRATVFLELGRLDEAESIVDDGLAIARKASSRHYEAVVRRVQGQILAARGQAKDAELAYDGAVAALTDSGSRLELAHALYMRGIFRGSKDAVDDAKGDLNEARDLYELTGARPMLWRTHAALGSLAGGQGNNTESDLEFAAARAVVEELSSEMNDRALRDRLRQRADRVLPPKRVLTPRQALQREYGGLTARERQVAAMVAQGMTNRDIAEALVLSERTVEGHASNIRAKLGFTTRTQIAAWAVAVGLVNGPTMESGNPGVPK